MRQLRKAPAKAIEQINSDDEMDDMPFLGMGKGKASRKNNSMVSNA